MRVGVTKQRTYAMKRHLEETKVAEEKVGHHSRIKQVKGKELTQN